MTHKGLKLIKPLFICFNYVYFYVFLLKLLTYLINTSLHRSITTLSPLRLEWVPHCASAASKDDIKVPVTGVLRPPPPCVGHGGTGC